MASHDVNVSCVSPALIETDIAKDMTQNTGPLDFQNSAGKIGKPEEGAAMVKFLLSDEASFGTGQGYEISGGRSVY